MDGYQDKYLAHQKRKKAILLEIMRERHSERMFADTEVDEAVIQELIDVAMLCPSSCNRHGVQIKVTADRDDKALLGGLLVGGTGWIHRAPVVLMLFGDPVAYKAGDEINYMVYLDAGVMVQQMFLAATAMGLHACFCNPNRREMNIGHFEKVFGPGVFCGALAIGYPPEMKSNV